MDGLVMLNGLLAYHKTITFYDADDVFSSVHVDLHQYFLHWTTFSKH